MKKIDSIILSGKESLPLIEGGKGIVHEQWRKLRCLGRLEGLELSQV